MADIANRETITTSPASKSATTEERRKAAAAMGSARTEAKAAASRRNGLKNALKAGRPVKPLSEIRCTCDAGESMTGHRWNCPRGQAIKRRQKAGKL